jgi:hypothetical protein
MSNVSLSQFQQSLAAGVDLSHPAVADGAGALSRAELTSADVDGDGRLAGPELDRVFRGIDRFDTNGDAGSFAATGRSGDSFAALKAAATPAALHAAVSGDQRRLENALTLWADSAHIDASARAGDDAATWQRRLTDAGRLEARSGGVDPMVARALDRAVVGASDAQLQSAASSWVERYSAEGQPFAAYTDEQRAELTAGVEGFLRDKRAFAQLNTFRPAPGEGLPTPGEGRAPEAGIRSWTEGAHAALDARYAASGLAEGDPAGLAVRDTAARRIDAAAELYRAASADPAALPEADGIRADYLAYLEAQPGDLAGAYDAVEARLRRRQGGKIADAVNSWPTLDQLLRAMNPFD